jgi:ATPase subunit of ABC transporter with duplicated ATPase domains
MSHSPITISSLSLSFNQQTCFKNFSAQVYPGSRIGIIGRNGAGKSSLLKAVQGLIEPSSGSINIPNNCIVGSIPQLSVQSKTSGGELFNQALTQALSLDPNLLLLDEPTNHLDRHNRQSLIKLLTHFHGTLIVASHDPELLRKCADDIWLIDQQQVRIFSGGYKAYEQTIATDQKHQQAAREQLKKERKNIKKAQQQEQQRAAQSKKAHRYENDKNIRGKLKQQGNATAGKLQKKLNLQQSTLEQQLQDHHDVEIITPRFTLSSKPIPKSLLYSVSNGSCGYNNHSILSSIFFQCHYGDRIALTGDNGSGKSTFIKALFNDQHVITAGDWHQHTSSVGYLDQHYVHLQPDQSVFDHIKEAVPTWTDQEARRHLNDFLFKTNEAVNKKASVLSGGEQARLSLALIAAQNPTALLLDEVTNNVDLITRNYIIQVLNQYQGALIVISHDDDFLQKIGITDWYEVKQGSISSRTSFIVH